MAALGFHQLPLLRVVTLLLAPFVPIKAVGDDEHQL
jgi:hypothetical protein